MPYISVLFATKTLKPNGSIPDAPHCSNAPVMFNDSLSESPFRVLILMRVDTSPAGLMTPFGFCAEVREPLDH